MTHKHMVLIGLLAVTTAGCGLETLEMPQMAAQTPVAMDRETDFPAVIYNSKVVPIKYDHNGRLGRLALNFKVRFAGIIKDETYIWEVNGGEKKGGFNSLLYPAKDGFLYAVEHDWKGQSGRETFYRVGRFQRPAGLLREGTPVSYRIDFPFEKRSEVAVAIPWAFLAKGVVFRMDVPTRLASAQEPPFFMAINPGYEKRFTPEERERIQPLLEQ